MRVGLLRHGEVDGGPRFRGHTDDPLTNAGLAQMYRTVDGTGGWGRLVSSPLVRCAEFASAFARRQSLPLTFDPRLKEMYFGAWEGCAAAEIMAKHPERLTRFWRDPNAYPPPGAEPLARFEARVLDAWREIVAHRCKRDVLVVTHGGVIRVLLCHVFGIPATQWHAFDVQPGHLYSVCIGADGSARPAGDTISRK